MTFQTKKLIFEPATPRSESFRVACFALMVGNAACVVVALLGNNWIIDAGGQPIHTERWYKLQSLFALLRQFVPLSNAPS